MNRTARTARSDMIATTTTRPVPDTPARRWWTSRPRHHDRPAEGLAVLQHGRAIVESGWVRSRRRAAPAAWTPGGPGAAGSARSCVVAAVGLAVGARDPRADLA